MEIKKQAFEWNEITRRISEEPFDSTTRAIRMTTKGDAHKIGPSENTKGGRWDPLGDYLAKRRWVKALEKEIDRVLPGRGRTLTGDAKAYNRTFFSSLLPKMNATQVESLIDQVNREISERKAKELEELNGGTDYPTQTEGVGPKANKFATQEIYSGIFDDSDDNSSLSESESIDSSIETEDIEPEADTVVMQRILPEGFVESSDEFGDKFSGTIKPNTAALRGVLKKVLKEKFEENNLSQKIDPQFTKENIVSDISFHDGKEEVDLKQLRGKELRDVLEKLSVGDGPAGRNLSSILMHCTGLLDQLSYKQAGFSLKEAKDGHETICEVKLSEDKAYINFIASKNVNQLASGEPEGIDPQRIRLNGDLSSTRSFLSMSISLADLDRGRVDSLVVTRNAAVLADLYPETEGVDS